jgi:flagellar biosynthesis repressor protein FlbT
MPLRVELKPFERIIIGDSVIINSGSRTTFLIDGDAPILREKDTLTPENADTPAKRLYHCVQTMYLKNDIGRHQASYLAALAELRQALAGSSGAIDNADADGINCVEHGVDCFEPAIAAIHEHVSAGSLYKALKEIRKLIKREQECVAA